MQYGPWKQAKSRRQRKSASKNFKGSSGTFSPNVVSALADILQMMSSGKQLLGMECYSCSLCCVVKYGVEPSCSKLPAGKCRGVQHSPHHLHIAHIGDRQHQHQQADMVCSRSFLQGQTTGRAASAINRPADIPHSSSLAIINPATKATTAQQDTHDDKLPHSPARTRQASYHGPTPD
ncbi:hypothetical protein Nepgr_009339 [Nepenthes gracilis]|uniref:Uncharacterized protein n=1 Tax=Nepenthes gracilis TaxID=150966 RepID=A0AAD3XK90_NEPGR|nr:hypothetical protein Nepgr_009339 [Nepenthes gracilis]